MGIEGIDYSDQHAELHTDGDQTEDRGPGLFDNQRVPHQKLEDIGENPATNGGINEMEALFESRREELADREGEIPSEKQLREQLDKLENHTDNFGDYIVIPEPPNEKINRFIKEIDPGELPPKEIDPK